MATFDTVMDDLASRYGLGAEARAFIKEVLAMMAGSPGGLGGFLDRLKSAGLTSEVASWLGRPDAAPLAARRVEQALGSAAVSGVANRLGLAQGVVATAMGYALPKIVGLLTPGGVVTAGVPAEVTRFLSQAPEATLTPRRVDAPPSPTPEQSSVTRWLWPALAALVVVALLSYFWSTLNRIPSPPPVAKAPEPPTVAQAPPPPPPPAAQAPASTETQATPPPPPAPPAATDAQATAPQPTAPASTETQATPPPPPAPPAATEAQATAPQPSPQPAAESPAAPASPATTEQAPATPAPPTTTAEAPAATAPAAVATAEPTAPTPAATPTRLALSNDGGVVRASGVVRDEDAKTSILDALNAVFGADKVKSDISVDQSAAAASWLGNFRAALEALRSASVDAVFEGDKVNIGAPPWKTLRATRSSRR